MSDAKSTPASPQIEPGVMSSLPKTRPQRPSARRDAARSKAAAKPKPKPTPKPKPKPTPKPGRAARAETEPPRAPRQGFEAESDVETGKTVQPPGGVELAASVVELLGDLAQSGLNSGARLLKDALRLPHT